MRTLNIRTISMAGSALLATVALAAGPSVEAGQPQTLSSQLSRTDAIALGTEGETMAQIPPLSTRQDAEGYLLPGSESIDVTLRNTSSSLIHFQVIGDTEPRVLPAGEETRLLGLMVPTHITFYEEEGGLTQARVVTVDPQASSIEVEFSQAANLGSEDTSLVVLDNGTIYLL